jgi:hypothetical protein
MADIVSLTDNAQLAQSKCQHCLQRSSKRFRT